MWSNEDFVKVFGFLQEMRGLLEEKDWETMRSYRDVLLAECNQAVDSFRHISDFASR